MRAWPGIRASEPLLGIERYFSFRCRLGMGSTQRKMRCFGVLVAGSLVLTIGVLYVLSDSHSDSLPPSTRIQPPHYQIHGHPLGPLQLQGSVLSEVWQVHRQQPGPLQSEGIEWAERINEQMMRQRYRGWLKRLEELR